MGFPICAALPGQEQYAGRQLHTVSYRSPEDFRGHRVVVASGGNSGAQILAEVSTVAETIWITQRPPCFMPDDVDGRVLFDVATQREVARRAGVADGGSVADLGDIVMVPSGLAARERGVLQADGTERACEAVIWCTGFRPTPGHLEPLAVHREDSGIKTVGTRSVEEPRLYLLGYGDWTGAASATLVCAGRTAKSTVAEIAERLLPHVAG
jgi:putative flavoprotein involved in K+ transport